MAIAITARLNPGGGCKMNWPSSPTYLELFNCVKKQIGANITSVSDSRIASEHTITLGGSYSVGMTFFCKLGNTATNNSREFSVTVGT